MQHHTLVTPATGKLIPLKGVQDCVFAPGTMGPGFGVQPTAGKLVAPVDGIVTMIAAGRQAIGFVTEAGLMVLVHLGIDTVELATQPPFELTVQVGAMVQAGAIIGWMDLTAINMAGKVPTVIVVVTNAIIKGVQVTPLLGPVTAGVLGARLTMPSKTSVTQSQLRRPKANGVRRLVRTIAAAFTN